MVDVFVLCTVDPSYTSTADPPACTFEPSHSSLDAFNSFCETDFEAAGVLNTPEAESLAKRKNGFRAIGVTGSSRGGVQREGNLFSFESAYGLLSAHFSNFVASGTEGALARARLCLLLSPTDKRAARCEFETRLAPPLPIPVAMLLKVVRVLGV